MRALFLFFIGAVLCGISAFSFVGCGRTFPLDYESERGGEPNSDLRDGGEERGERNDSSVARRGRDGGKNRDSASDYDGELVMSCDADEACDDADPCTEDRCISGRCQNRLIDRDDDGFVSLACGGDDCNDLNPNVFAGHQEICNDGADNDCNGVADCFDPACYGFQDCGCQPAPSGEICTNGLDDDCDQTVDCNDPDCIGTVACGCSDDEYDRCEDGYDNDCDGQTDCDDTDCSDNAGCVCRMKREICDNGEDDDCDLRIDCADSDCSNRYPCICVPPGEAEVCSDGVDNDCDLLLDCADPDCASSPSCRDCSPEICDDGIDNNCDNTIDCADPSCLYDDACLALQEICNNRRDDDRDGMIDCADPDCADNPYCVSQQATCLSPRYIAGSGVYTGDTTGNVNLNRGSCGGDAGEAIFYFVLDEPASVHIDSIGSGFDSALYLRMGSCEQGVELGCDDDSAGSEWAAALDFSLLFPGTYFLFLDGFTTDPQLGPNEGPFQLNIEIRYNPSELCFDGVDNDGDRYSDCADSECVDQGRCYNCNSGNPPVAEYGVAACTDGIDNDCDGLTDCADDDCSANRDYPTECCDGIDQNGNGIPDDFNCRCAGDADCMPSYICYTHTTFTCGAPCTNYFGDTCPFIQKGTYCNSATSQCEF